MHVHVVRPLIQQTAFPCLDGQQEPVIFLITPTFQRKTQKADLTALCHTLKHIPLLLWIVVEDSASRSPLIQALLARCSVPAVHLTVKSPELVIPYTARKKKLLKQVQRLLVLGVT